MNARRERGTRKGSRALTCCEQAVPGLRWFRQNTDITAPNGSRRRAKPG